MAKSFAWSYSALDGFHQCPKKHYFEKINKKYPFQSNPAADYGKALHKAFELYATKNKPLPMDMLHHQPFLDNLLGLGTEFLGEQKLALTRDFKPTGWFDNDVWCRSIIDLVVMRDDSAIICDYKSGRRVDTFDQVDHQAAMLAVYKPEIMNYTTGYYYTKEKAMVRHALPACDMTKVWQKFYPRVELMEKMIVDDEFPAKQNFLCKSYCPVKECKYNGG